MRVRTPAAEACGATGIVVHSMTEATVVAVAVIEVVVFAVVDEKNARCRNGKLRVPLAFVRVPKQRYQRSVCFEGSGCFKICSCKCSLVGSRNVALFIVLVFFVVLHHRVEGMYHTTGTSTSTK